MVARQAHNLEVARSSRTPATKHIKTMCFFCINSQFRLPFIGGLVAPNQGLFPEYDAGIYTEGNTNMLVSRGIGNSILPFRINNRPEVILIELQAE